MELENGLSSRQSIEMLVLLKRSGIAADRQKQKVGRTESYSVLVPRSLYSQALEVVYEYKLPSQSHDSLEEFTRPKGFTPNSSEISRLRLDYALGLQIERLIGVLPGVVEARALVRTYLQDSYVNSSENAPGASLAIRYTLLDGTMPIDEKQVIGIVAQAVPNIDAKNIKISLAQVDLPAGSAAAAVKGSYVPLHRFLPNIRVAAKDMPRAGYVFLIYLTVLLGAGILGGAFLSSFFLKSKMVRTRRNSNASKINREALTSAGGGLRNSERLIGSHTADSR